MVRILGDALRQARNRTKRVIFVLGMGRSGTSAIARLLALCGGAMPADLVGASEGNPRGHWEPFHALSLNDAFLARHASSWYDSTLRLQNELTISTAERDSFVAQIGEFFASCPDAPVLIIKDPRISALTSYWFEAARKASFSIAAVIALRHPEEVAASLAHRDGLAPQLSSLLWLKYNLLAERTSRGVPRVFVQYSSLLEDWQTQVRRISKALGVRLLPDIAGVTDFLTTDLHRQRSTGAVIDYLDTNWVPVVYEQITRAARGKPLNTPELDRIFEAYSKCERTFRISLDESRAHVAGFAGL